jgi:hypothetical protein
MSGIKIGITSLIALSLFLVLFPGNILVVASGVGLVVTLLIYTILKNKSLSNIILISMAVIAVFGIIRIAGMIYGTDIVEAALHSLTNLPRSPVVLTRGIGDNIDLDGKLRVTVESVRIADKVTVSMEKNFNPLQNYTYTAPPGFRFALVDFEVENVKATTLGYFMWDEYVVSRNNSVYSGRDFTFLLETPHSTIETPSRDEDRYFCSGLRSIFAGETEKFCTFFEIPEDAALKSYEFRPWSWETLNKMVSVSL